MKSISAIHSTITENTENILVKRAPHISIRENHSVSISAMANSFHDIIAKLGIAREAISCLLQIVTLRGCEAEKRMGDQRGTKVDHV